MTGRSDLLNRRRFFSLTASVLLILSSLLVGISVQEPNAAAIDHDVGNLDVKGLNDKGRILMQIEWNNLPQTVESTPPLSFIGLVIDHDNYDHTAGAEDIADAFASFPYGNADDFQLVTPISMIMDDGITQKSYASFQNKGAGTLFPDDLLINQTAWTVKDKDWAILQWTLSNVKSPATTLTNVRIGLEVPLSKEGARYGLGGSVNDAGDDVDGYDGVDDIYWARDTGDDTTIGFGSAIVSDPITHYYAKDYYAEYANMTDPDNMSYLDPDPKYYKNFFANDTWLYERIIAPSDIATDGVTPKNITATVGWDGFDIPSGESRTVTLVIAINGTYNDMKTAIADAQDYYLNVATGFQLTEIRDSGPARIEVFNNGREPLPNPDSLLTLTSNSGPLTGNWNPTTIPTYGYSYLTVTLGSIDPEGDTITLEESSVPIDQVSFGQDGIVPDPLAGESTARRFDISTASYLNDWLRDATPTWDSQNDVGVIMPVTQVILNRVLSYPFGGDEVEGYVELMYTGPSTKNISNYKIVCDDEFMVPLITTLNTTNRFYVFRQVDDSTFFTNMNAAGDNVYLYDNNDNLLDMVGWSSSHNQGDFMSRIPDGNDTEIGSHQGYDDATSTAAGWVFNNLPNLMITEFSVNDQNTARIELYNPRGGDKVLTRWTLDVETAPNTMTGGWTPDDIIPSGGYRYFDRSGGAQLKPEGDRISLYYSGTNFNGDVSYGNRGVAPDPLVGESTARFWDNGIPGYNNDWNRDATDTFGAQNDVPAINSTPWGIMNEVMFNPSLDPDGKYVVLMNVVPLTAWNISNFYLVCDDEYQLPTYPTGPGGWDGILYYGWTLIIRYGDDSPASDAFFQNMDASGDNVYLYDSNGELLDMVGWNNPHNMGMDVRRVPDGTGTYQGFDDTSSVAAGWVFNSPLQILVTEITDSESTSPSPQIEVYNSWYPTIDFNVGFAFDSVAGISGGWAAPGTADSGQYAVYDVTSGLDFEGDTLSFTQNTILIDDISYGLNGLVPDPLIDESVERYWNGASYTNVWERNWSSGPNFGSQNDVPPPTFSSPLILNEVMFNPNVAADGFVELFLTSGMINISGYKIVGDTEYIIPNGTILSTLDDRFFYLMNSMDSGFFSALNPSGDNVYLYDDNGSLLDMVGWSSSHTQGMTMVRMPNGTGTRDGFDDTSSTAAGWVFDNIPTVQLVKVNMAKDMSGGLNSRKQYGQLGDVLYYNLTITNKQSVDDAIDIINSTLNGYPVVILDETGTFVITDVFLPAGTSINITIMVILPTSIPFIERDNITITIQSQNVTLFMDSILLEAIIYPFIHPEKYASPQEIYLSGTGHDEISIITLNLTGMGAVMELMQPQDVIFCVDVSGSMDPWAISQIRIGLEGYVDEMDDPDQGAVVTFGSPAVLMSPLTNDYVALKNDINNIPGPGGNTYMGEALELAINELLLNGNSSHIQVIILLTDGQWNGAVDPIVQADRAATENITIFTIGLEPASGNLDEPTLMLIASLTGGQYFYAPDASFIPEIYKLIAGYIGDIAGRDSDTTDASPMIKDVLPPWIELVPFSFSIIPDVNSVVSGFRTLEWNLSTLGIGESWEVTFQVKSTMLGWVPSNEFAFSRVYYEDYFDNVHLVVFPECWLNVLPGIPLPPLLEIEMPNINDVLLKWDKRISPGSEYYLIYRSSDPTQFDFSTPWVDTSVYIDNGIIPNRISWNDTGAADSSEQWYYCIRSVNNMSELSYSSRTVGKWTKTFSQGVSSFSLPLQPIETITPTADYYLNDMSANYIKWMNPATHEWLQHGGGPLNDAPMEVGQGYEVNFLGPNNKYTFLGMPGAQIKYHTLSTVGFDPATEADSLGANVNPSGDITIFWVQPSSMWDPLLHKYNIYRSTTRDGFDDGSAQLMDSFDVGPLTWTDIDVANASTEYYYMIIPMNETGIEGASSYSIGVVTLDILSVYDTIGIPLSLTTGTETADYYCDQILGSVGINYYIEADQRWSWHSTIMPSGAFDPQLIMIEGYQISTTIPTRYSFIGH